MSKLELKHCSCVCQLFYTALYLLLNFMHSWLLYHISLNRGVVAGPLFPSGPFSTWPLNKSGLYMDSASIYGCRSRCGFLTVLFCTVYSLKLESNNIVALFLGQNGDQYVCETRTCTGCCVYMQLTIIQWAGPGFNSRPSLYLLKNAINPQPLNGTGFYSEEASI